MSKLFFLFCYIFGCHGSNLVNAMTRSIENGTCKSFGRFPNSLDLECTSYILCAPVDEGHFVGEIVQCPNGTVYNATRGRCGTKPETFICPHICSDVGKTPYRKIDCQHYISCERDTKTSYMTATLEICPNETWFCGEFEKCVPGPPDSCVLNYTTSTLSSNSTTDPEITSSYPNTTITTTTTTSGTNTTLVESETTTVTSTNRTSTWTTPVPSTTTESDDFRFTCDKVGRFPISGICNQYILCSQGVNDEWVMSLEKCPKGRVFSATRSRCVVV